MASPRVRARSSHFVLAALVLKDSSSRRLTLTAKALAVLSTLLLHCTQASYHTEQDNPFIFNEPSSDDYNEWEALWAHGLQPGEAFDAGACSQSLKMVLADWEKAARTRKCRMLVPGCGRGYDVIEAARIGFDALGLDVAPSAIAAAEEYRKSWGKLRGRAEFSTTDFFHLQESNSFDLIYDYLFFAVIDPSARDEWARTMRRLLKPGSELVTLIFPIGDHPAGPPFAMSTELVRSFLEPQGFVCEFTQPVPSNASHPGRAGKEVLARWRAPMT